MADVFFNEFADIAALEGQRDQVIKLFDEVKKNIIGLNQVSKDILNASGGKELNASLKDAAKFSKEYKDIIQVLQQKVKDLEAANAKLAASQQIINQSQRANSAETRNANEATKEQVNSTRELLEIAARNEIVQKQLTAAKKALAEEFRKGAITEKEYIARLADIKEQQLQVSVTSQAVTTALKNIEKESQAADGSLDKLRAQLNLALQAFDKLSQDQKASSVGSELLKKIQDLTKEISAQEQVTGRFQRNVGNYAGSLAKPFETLIKKVNELKNNLKNGIGIGGTKDQEDIKQTANLVETLEKNIEKAGVAGTTASRQVKILENSFNSISLTTSQFKGDETLTSFVTTFAQEVGEAKDNVQDLKDEIRLNASDTKGIDNVVGSLNALAGIAQGAAGAYALFGGSQEDAAKITAKLIAIQGIANSVQQVGQELTRKGTIANRVYEFSQKQLSIAFDSTATSAQRFQAALASIGIGLAILLIGTIVSKLAQWTSETEKVEKANEELNKQLEDQNRLLDNNIKSIQRRGKLQAEYIKQAGGTAGDLFKNDTAIIKSEISAIEAQITAVNERQKNLRSKIQSEASKAQKSALLFGVNIDDREAYKRAADKYKLIQDNLNNQLTDLQIKYTDKQNELTQRTEEEKTRIAEEQAKKREEAAKKSAENRLKSEQAFFDAEKEFLQRIAEAYKTASQNENITLDERLGFLDQYYSQRLLIINKQADFEKSKKGITEGEKAFIDQKSYTEQLNLLSEFSKSRLDIIKQEADEEIRLQIEDREKQLKNIEDNYKAEQEATKRLIAGRQQLAQEEYQKGLEGIQSLPIEEKLKKEKELTEKYNLQKQFINAQAQQQAIQDEINYYNNLIATTEKGSKARKDAEKALKDAQSELNAARIQEAIDVETQITQIQEQAANQRQSIIGRVRDAVINFLNSQFDTERNNLQLLKEEKDAEAAAEIERIQKSTLAEQDKAAAIAQIQASQKINNDRIEAQQKNVEERRAKFQRLIQLAQITGDTIKTVNSLKAEAAITKAKAVTTSAEALKNPLLIPAATALNAAAASIAALIPQTIAAGVVQAGFLLATPIPRYKTGLFHDYEGFGIVGDGGKPELITRADGRMEITPATDTLTWLSKGDRIHPDAEEAFRTMNIGMLSKMQRSDASDIRIVGKKIEQLNDGFDNVVKAIKNKKEAFLNITEEGWQWGWRDAHGQTNYIHRNTQW